MKLLMPNSVKKMVSLFRYRFTKSILLCQIEEHKCNTTSIMLEVGVAVIMIDYHC